MNYLDILSDDIIMYINTFLSKTDALNLYCSKYNNIIIRSIINNYSDIDNHIDNHSDIDNHNIYQRIRSTKCDSYWCTHDKINKCQACDIQLCYINCYYIGDDAYCYNCIDIDCNKKRLCKLCNTIDSYNISTKCSYCRFFMCIDCTHQGLYRCSGCDKHLCLTCSSFGDLCFKKCKEKKCDKMFCIECYSGICSECFMLQYK